MKKVIEVWDHNVDRHLNAISGLVAVKHGSYVCIDTEFPGFIQCSPRGASDEELYRDLKFNVDKLKIVQLGLTFYNEKGRPFEFSWQVNLKGFDPRVDIHAPSSVRLLERSGIDIEKNRVDGVDEKLFSRLLWEKLVSPCRGKTKWITFHGLYDLAYIVKLLTGMPLPNTLPEFLSLVGKILGSVYDVKYMAKFCCDLDENMGLMKMAETLGVKPDEEQHHHQAGYDSRLIGKVFWMMKEKFGIDEDNFAGAVYGAELRDLVQCSAPQGSYGTDPFINQLPSPSSSSVTTELRDLVQYCSASQGYYGPPFISQLPYPCSSSYLTACAVCLYNSI